MSHINSSYRSRSNSRLFTQSLILLSEEKKNQQRSLQQTFSSTFTQKFTQNNTKKSYRKFYKNPQKNRSMTLALSRINFRSPYKSEINKSRIVLSQFSMRKQLPISKVNLKSNKFQGIYNDIMQAKSVFISKKLQMTDCKKNNINRMKLNSQKFLVKQNIAEPRTLFLRSARNMPKYQLIKELHRKYTFFKNSS